MPVTNFNSGFVVDIRILHWFNWWYCEPSTLHIPHKLGMKIDKFKYQKFIASIVCTYQKLHNQRWNQDQSGSVFFEGDCWLFHLEEAATFWAWPDSVLMSSGCKLTHSWKVKVIEVHLSDSESGWGLPEWKWKWLRSTWVPSSPASHLAAVTVGFQRFLVGGKRSSCFQFILSVTICILPKSPFLVSVQLQWQSEQEMKVQAARLISIIGPESKLPSPLVQWSWPVLLTSSSAGRRGQIQPGGRKGGDIDDKLDAVRLKVVIYLSGI